MRLGAGSNPRNPQPEIRKLIPERKFFIDNLLDRIHVIIVMIRWTGLAPWEFEFSFPGSLTSTSLVLTRNLGAGGARLGAAAVQDRVLLPGTQYPEPDTRNMMPEN